MDILKEINDQIKRIKQDDNSNYLDLIYNHLDRAEYYYKQGAKDQQFFNDVIYRANQAYEGALKEAYKILAGKTDNELQKTSPHLIEKHFKENQIFKDRVLQLFENYRQEWRNKSTHDYKLIFDENEAFIALTNVSSFVHLLLKQIEETIAFHNERKKMLEAKERLIEIKVMLSNKKESLAQKIFHLIRQFAENGDSVPYETGITLKTLNSSQLMGMLHGFFAAAAPELTIHVEPMIRFKGTVLRPDFIFELDNEKVLMEVKGQHRKGALQTHINQVVNYLEASDISTGILYFASFSDPNTTIKVETQNISTGEKHFTLNIITT